LKPRKSLGTVLVASANKASADAIGQLVAESGFTPAFPVGVEAPWLSVTRTQPRLVICDSDAPIKRLQRLVTEVSARSVPLLVTHAAESHTNLPALAHVERVTWLRFPVSAKAFRRILCDLVPRDSDRGVPHKDEPSEAEAQYRSEKAQAVAKRSRRR
jgi:DNA-binding NtrC family response regulator